MTSRSLRQVLTIIRGSRASSRQISGTCRIPRFAWTQAAISAMTAAASPSSAAVSTGWTAFLDGEEPDKSAGSRRPSAAVLRLATCSATAMISLTPLSSTPSRNTAAVCAASQNSQRLVMETAACIASLVRVGILPWKRKLYSIWL